MQQPITIEAIRREFQDSNKRGEAVAKLGRIDPSEWGDLLALALQDKSEQTRWSAILTAVNVFAKKDHEKTLLLILLGLQDSSEEVQSMTASLTGYVGRKFNPDDEHSLAHEVITIIIAFSKSPNEDLRLSAIQGLQSIKHPLSRQALAQMIANDPEIRLRRFALEQLGHHQTQAALEVITPYLTHPELQESAFTGLYVTLINPDLRTEANAQRLITLVEEANLWGLAQYALPRITPLIEPQLAIALQSANSEARLSAVKAFAFTHEDYQVTNPAIIQQLLALLNDKTLRNDVIIALGHTRDQAVAGRLEQLLQEELPYTTQRVAVAAILNIDLPNAVSIAQQLLESLSPDSINYSKVAQEIRLHHQRQAQR